MRSSSWRPAARICPPRESIWPCCVRVISPIMRTTLSFTACIASLYSRCVCWFASRVLASACASCCAISRLISRTLSSACFVRRCSSTSATSISSTSRRHSKSIVCCVPMPATASPALVSISINSRSVSSRQ